MRIRCLILKNQLNLAKERTGSQFEYFRFNFDIISFVTSSSWKTDGVNGNFDRYIIHA